MGEKRGNDSSAKNFIWVLALEAPRVNEKKPEGTHRDFLTIDEGQDIREEVLNYFRNSTNNSENYNGCKRMGSILSATGSVLHPNSDKDSYKIKYLPGRFIIFEDGRVKQYKPWTISCVGSSCLVITDEFNGRLIAAEPVQDSYKIKYLPGRFIIFEDGRVKQYKPWTISCVGSSCLVITDEFNGRLIAAEPVQVTVGTFPINPSS